MLAVMFVIFVGGCGKDNSNSSSSNPSVSSKPTFQGIAYNEEDIKKSDLNTFSIGTISIRSKIKAERKEFIDEYYAKNKQVTDYEKWKKKIQSLIDDTNSMIARINKMKPKENATNDDAKLFNNAKKSAVELLDVYSKKLAENLAEVQSAQNNGKGITYKLLDDLSISAFDTEQRFNFIHDSIINDYRIFVWIYDRYGYEKLGQFYIPKLGIMIFPYDQDYDMNANEITKTFAFVNHRMKDFDMSKIKVTLNENNVSIDGDSNGMNQKVREMSAFAKNTGFVFATSGVFQPIEDSLEEKDVIIASYIFKPISRNFLTDDGKGTAYYTVSYDGQPILYTEYNEVIRIFDKNSVK